MSNRRARKKLKLQTKGTYHRADQWWLDRAATRIWLIGEGFCRAIERYTGRPCPVVEMMLGFGFQQDPVTGRVRRVEQ